MSGRNQDMKKTNLLFATAALALLLGTTSVSAGVNDPVKIGKNQDGSGWTIVENQKLSVRLTEIEADNEWGYSWKVLLENKTDQELMFSIQDSALNGVCLDPFWAAEVAAGATVEETIQWDDELLDEEGFGAVTTAAVGFWVYDTNDVEKEYLEEYYVIDVSQDSGASPNNAPQLYRRKSQSQDMVLFETEECRMTVTGFEMDETWGYTMKVYLENLTDRQICFSIDNASLNETECDPFWAAFLLPGTVACREVCWSPEDLKEKEIGKVEDISLDLTVYDVENYLEEAFLQDTFTVKSW